MEQKILIPVYFTEFKLPFKEFDMTFIVGKAIIPFHHILLPDIEYWNKYLRFEESKESIHAIANGDSKMFTDYYNIMHGG